MTGFEPATSWSRTNKHPDVSTANAEVTDDQKLACIPACIRKVEPSNGGAPCDEIDHTFGEALALIADLPLTKAEKAEAVRRLLTGRKANATKGATR